ncbi:MAG: DUF393 domain-containing protein [Bacteroidia bacterium]|nr:DUF393 domain-containing protein [Bacteroidia bacterium]MCZ2248925.1 DUF393 domain-containing protein [Bacteroidia bacterium]
MWDKDHKILLFDGVCNLCNSTVNFVINRDRKKQIRYAAIQSPAGKKLLMKYNISPNYLSSLIFIDQEKVFLNSSGALRLCLYLKPLWPLMYVFIIVPPMLRNAIYNIIANNRYKWFGKLETCMVPSTQVQSLFITNENEI